MRRSMAHDHQPDLILLDVMMPKRDGFEVCRLLKSDPTLPFMPIILVTAKGDSRDIVAGLEMRRRRVPDQAGGPCRADGTGSNRSCASRRCMTRYRNGLGSLPNGIDAGTRVADQLGEIQRVNRLKRFLAPQVAESVVSTGDDQLLESHRRDVAIVFCDLRGFTALAETAEPEEVMEVLREYHGALGEIIHRFEGTLERFLGDGLMVLFNDPIPCADRRCARSRWQLRCAIA